VKLGLTRRSETDDTGDMLSMSVSPLPLRVEVVLYMPCMMGHVIRNTYCNDNDKVVYVIRM
jgi:hypothetical protein